MHFCKTYKSEVFEEDKEKLTHSFPLCDMYAFPLRYVSKIKFPREEFSTVHHHHLLSELGPRAYTQFIFKHLPQKLRKMMEKEGSNL